MLLLPYQDIRFGLTKSLKINLIFFITLRRKLHILVKNLALKLKFMSHDIYRI